MDQELLIIDLLSAKKLIYEQAKKNRNKNLLTAFVFLILTTVVFFGIGTFVYQHLQIRVHSIDSGYWLRGIYHFSFVLGSFSTAIITVFFLVILFHGVRFRHNFQHVLERMVQKASLYPVIYQDKDAYYLAEKNGRSKIQLVKADCIELTTTFDGAVIYMGIRQLGFGFVAMQVFVLTAEPAQLPTPFPKQQLLNSNWLLVLLAVVFVSASGVFIHDDGLKRHRNLYGTTNQNTSTTTSTSQQTTTSAHLLEQHGTAPTTKTDQTSQLKLNQQTNELYMTTDSGSSWRFIPLKPDWLRTGSYTLTAGEIPIGYWMDKSYEVSAEFSWFIYSDDDKNLYFLTSKDDGKTWEKALVSDSAQRIRYRKAQFFADGSGILVYSTMSPEVSSEGLEIYQTNDYGKTWTRRNGTTIDQAVQNVSFVNPALGFVSTRGKLYYTNNSGSSFKEAVVTIPAEYATGGLDLFQSPNEITQVSTNQLETKFYLVKTSGIDQGKMFACLYQSSDNGETWQFSEQLSQVENSD
ncbi:WD40/YVTN/BNR-like repeat-containing protein [Enterococcus hermanniensis]|uniref:Glycosyl hydrolase n=1 Tax=Enterococcus hermanniensis TaxID=249189 RepID=A0A1L8TKT0_9ENTE|nr:hypothetical protein [Enterococcus hermanniensis]OJG44931.1 hypothetical protein RV04_GL000499 [Enterococcus hermanniensis]